MDPYWSVDHCGYIIFKADAAKVLPHKLQLASWHTGQEDEAIPHRGWWTNEAEEISQERFEGPVDLEVLAGSIFDGEKCSKKNRAFAGDAYFP